MLHLARHRAMPAEKLVVKILLMMVSFGVIQIIAGAYPALLSAGSLKASWNANTEPDLAGYKLYYGLASGKYTVSINVGKVTQYTVTQLNEEVVFYFVLTAYDTAGNESAYSQEVPAKIPAVDRTPPSVNSVKPLDRNTIEIKFNEAVAAASAQNKTNYVIDNGITISSAALQADNVTAILTTSAHEAGKTYKITIQKIADRAIVPNVMSQAFDFNYSLPAVDRTSPAVASFRAVNSQALEIVFNEAVTVASAQNVTNYAITPAIAIQSAKLQTDGRTVTLATGVHATGVNYTLTVRDIADRAATPNLMSQPASFTYSFRAVDEVPPAVSNVRIVNPTLVEVLFSEPVTAASAKNLDNYAINNGIAISSAVLQADTRTIKLTTSEHTAGETYALTVRNFADRATPANVMPEARTFTYSLQVEDLQAPEINSVTMIDLAHLLIVFNEQVTAATAENVDNYSISDGIEVQQASLAGNGLEVTLFTTAHLYNKDYNVTIVNIKDRSPAGNTLAAGNTFTYFLANQPDDNSNHLGVESLSPARYDFASLEAGQSYYIDRPYVVTQAPASKRGMLLIKTANTDRSNTAENFLSFTLTREKNVYVAYDSRATQPPNWLRNSFTRTNETIVVSESAGRLNLWKIRGMSGRMTLGGNMAPGVQTNTSLSMYVVLIEDVQTGPDAQAPQSFVLKQNYPNPFSLTGGNAPGQTKIEYYLREQHQVELKVHNTLGQVVRTLYSGLLPSGSHDLTWDGRDDRGELLPTGKYLCTLEVRDEMTNGEFTMSAALNRQTKVITLVK